MRPPAFPVLGEGSPGALRQVHALDETRFGENMDVNARSRPRERGEGPPTRRNRPADNGPADFFELRCIDTVPPAIANRHALKRRLERVAREADRRGHHHEAAIARWLLAGAA